MPTIHDVAAAARVSTSTVSRVLNGGSVSTHARQRVEAAIKQLGYRPNAVARGLVNRRTHMIGVIVSDLADPYYTEILQGIEARAVADGYDLMVCGMRWDTDTELVQLQRLRERQVDGIIIVSGPDMPEGQKEKADKHAGEAGRYETPADWPTVYIDRSLPHLGCAIVGIDNFQAAKEAVAHLISLGHTAIGHITGPPQASWSKERLYGYEEALREAGLEVRPSFVAAGHFTKDGGAHAARHILLQPRRPTAIFAANDLMALGVLQVAAAMNLAVPGDLAVVGFDDIWLLAPAGIPLTTVRQPRYDMGYAAANLVLQTLARTGGCGVGSANSPDDDQTGRRAVVLPTRLIVRATCGGGGDALARRA